MSKQEDITELAESLINLQKINYKLPASLYIGLSICEDVASTLQKIYNEDQTKIFVLDRTVEPSVVAPDCITSLVHQAMKKER